MCTLAGMKYCPVAKSKRLCIYITHRRLCRMLRKDRNLICWRSQRSSCTTKHEGFCDRRGNVRVYVYIHRPYIFRRRQVSQCFCLGSLGSFSHGTLPDYLHRPYMFRRGGLTRFLLLGSLGSLSHSTLPDYVHRQYIFPRGALSPSFPGSLGSLYDSRPAGDKTWESDVLALNRCPK